MRSSPALSPALTAQLSYLAVAVLAVWVLDVAGPTLLE